MQPEEFRAIHALKAASLRPMSWDARFIADLGRRAKEDSHLSPLQRWYVRQLAHRYRRQLHVQVLIDLGVSTSNTSRYASSPSPTDLENFTADPPPTPVEELPLFRTAEAVTPGQPGALPDGKPPDDQ